MRQRIQGTVTLEVVVSREGIPVAIRVTRSLDPGDWTKRPSRRHASGASRPVAGEHSRRCARDHPAGLQCPLIGVFERRIYANHSESGGALRLVNGAPSHARRNDVILSGAQPRGNAWNRCIRRCRRTLRPRASPRHHLRWCRYGRADSGAATRRRHRRRDAWPSHRSSAAADVDLSASSRLTLDEADWMRHMGFLPALRTVVATVPRRRQTSLFSARSARSTSHGSGSQRINAGIAASVLVAPSAPADRQQRNRCGAE